LQVPGRDPRSSRALPLAAPTPPGGGARGAPARPPPHEEDDMNEDIGTSVMSKLGIGQDELNSLYVTGPVAGFVGTEVAADLAERFGLDVSEPLGGQLAAKGVLTDAEAEWMDDVE
jgi:hypothetical protein